MKILLLLAALAVPAYSADCYVQGWDHLNDIWKISITTTDMFPQSHVEAVIDTTRDQEAVVVTSSGQLIAGITESPNFATDVKKYWDAATFSDLCTLGIKTTVLLQKNGASFGKRIARYVFVVSPSGFHLDEKKQQVTTASTVSGRVRYDVYDSNDILTGSINGTFTGASISKDSFANDDDSFWQIQ